MLPNHAGFFEPTKAKKRKNGNGQNGKGTPPLTVIARAYEEAMSSDLVSSFALSNKDSTEAAEAEVRFSVVFRSPLNKTGSQHSALGQHPAKVLLLYSTCACQGL